MILDMFAGGQRDLLDQVARNPARSLAPDVGESFAATWEANRRTTGVLSEQFNQADYLQGRLDDFERRTGERILNPLSSGAVGPERELMFNHARSRFGAKAAELDDARITFPGDEDIARGGLELAKRSVRRTTEISEGASGPAATVGWLGAEIAGGIVDPLNAVAIAATPSGGGLLLGALRAGLGTAVQQTASEALTYTYQREVNPEHGIGAAAANIAGAAVFGAGADVTLRGIGAAWRRLRNRSPEAAAAQTLEVRDAGTVVERGADLEANNPYRTGLAGHAAHAEAVAKIEADLFAGRTPTLPEAAAREAGARTGTAFYPGGRVDVRYGVVDLADLVTSHDGDFRIRPEYPGELQPRDRAGAAARDQVQRIFSDFQPERLGPNPEANAGAPIIGPGGIVESGNGRALALGQVYAAGGSRAADYRGFLERQGYDTSGLRQPVLVAHRVTDMEPDARAAFAHATNGSAALRLSATEQALSDARHIGGDLAGLLRGSDVKAAANRDFVRGLVARVPEGERGGMLTRTGTLSAGGARRIEAALVARAYGDPDVLARALDHPDPNIKAIAGALTDSSPEWVRMREAVTAGEIAAGHDITDDVMAAVKAVMRARDEGRPVWEVLHQGDLLGSDMSAMAARLFFRDGDEMARPASRKAIGEALGAYAAESRKNTSAARLLDDALAPDDVMRAVARRPPEAEMPAGTRSLLAEARRPENIDAAAANANVPDAAMAELNRLLEIDGFATRPIPLAEPDGAGGVRWAMGSLDDALRELDGQISLAAEVRACATPMARAA